MFITSTTLLGSFLWLLQLWVCGDGTVSKFGGDVQSYKVLFTLQNFLKQTFADLIMIESYCEQYQGSALSMFLFRHHVLDRPIYVEMSLCATRKHAQFSSWSI